MPRLPFLLIALVAAAGLTQMALGRTDLGGGHRGLALGGMCPISCSELDDDWPAVDLVCPEADRGVPRHAIARISVHLVQLGRGHEMKRDDFPFDECYGAKPDADARMFYYDQGSFALYYFSHSHCGCGAGVQPKCDDKAAETDKCNLTRFTMCKVTKPNPSTHKPTTCHIKTRKTPIDTPPDPYEDFSSDYLDDSTMGFKSDDLSFRYFHNIQGAWYQILGLLQVFGI